MQKTIQGTALLAVGMMSLAFVQATVGMTNPIGANLTADSQTQINVGGISITIPDPGWRYPESSHRMPQFADKLSRTITEKQRLHAIFADANKTQTDWRLNGLRRHMDVQTNRNFESQTITAKQFKEFKKLFKRAGDSKYKNSGMRNDFRNATALSTEQLSGICLTGDQIVGYRFFQTVATSRGNVRRVSVIGVCVVNGKLIQINVHADFNNRDDATWTADTAKNWMNLIIDSNK